MGRKKSKFSIRIHGSLDFRQVYLTDSKGNIAEDANHPGVWYEKIQNHWSVYNPMQVTDDSMFKTLVVFDIPITQNFGDRPFRVDYGTDPTDENSSKIHQVIAYNNNQPGQYQISPIDGKVRLVALGDPIHGKGEFLSLSPEEWSRRPTGFYGKPQVRGRKLRASE